MGKGNRLDGNAWNEYAIGGAHEAILFRVFQKLGLTKKETDQYFSGFAHFPWNRMGNLNGWDGPLPNSYFQKQVKLTHQMLDRMKPKKSLLLLIKIIFNIMM